jgi:Transglutaminase-like superfamily
VRTLQKLLRLSLAEAVILAQAAVLLPAVRVAFQFVTIAHLQRLSDHIDRSSSVNGLPPEAAARLVRIAAERGLYRAKCLERSLVLRWILGRQGVDARIIFGARKAEEEMQAHAWVEVDGVSLDEDHDSPRQFSPFEKQAASGIN